MKSKQTYEELENQIAELKNNTKFYDCLKIQIQSSLPEI